MIRFQSEREAWIGLALENRFIVHFLSGRPSRLSSRDRVDSKSLSSTSTSSRRLAIIIITTISLLRDDPTGCGTWIAKIRVHFVTSCSIGTPCLNRSYASIQTGRRNKSAHFSWLKTPLYDLQCLGCLAGVPLMEQLRSGFEEALFSRWFLVSLGLREARIQRSKHAESLQTSWLNG